MNLFTGAAADEFFGGEVPAGVREILDRAAQAPRGEVGTLLWTAQALAPRCLPVYYALCKHHATRRELDMAERAARRRGAGLAGAIARLDPGARVGDDVIASLLASLGRE